MTAFHAHFSLINLYEVPRTQLIVGSNDIFRANWSNVLMLTICKNIVSEQNISTDMAGADITNSLPTILLLVVAINV